MYNRIVDLVIDLIMNNLNDLIVMVVAQPAWITYLTCVYLMLTVINKSIDTSPPQQPNMNPAIMFFVNETYLYYSIFLAMFTGSMVVEKTMNNLTHSQKHIIIDKGTVLSFTDELLSENRVGFVLK